MKLLMFGANGQVAREVLRRRGAHEVTALGRDRADLTEPNACARLIEATDADVILNAAAWTAVDDAEAAEEEAAVVNGAAPAAMADAAARRDIPFIHISTDYVFSGIGDFRWTEEAATHPKCAYGWTKLAGEQGVTAAGGAYAILRTSWVFSAHGSNFVKTMLRVGEGKDRLDVVDDQIGGPTPAAAIADACLRIAGDLARRRGHTGVYHFSGAPNVSWRDLAIAIFEEAGMDVAVDPILTKDWPTPAARPKNSRLDCAKILRDYGIEQPDWREGLRDVVKELKA